MGIFENIMNKIQNNATNKTNPIANKIIKEFYADYPEKPYVSPNRKEEWIEQAKLFKKTMLVPKSMMKRFSDGLLPGHVYMLYWLNKYTNKSVPAYFEYKYGIDFEKEKHFLIENDFLDDSLKPTDKGEMAINKHYSIIENHKPPKTNRSIESADKQILAQRDNMKRNGFKEYEFIASKNSCDICKKLNGKRFMISDMQIGVNAPPMHEGCRCSIAAHESDDDYETWLNFISKGGTTKEWNKRK